MSISLRRSISKLLIQLYEQF
uniref:Uncharacterized protein n=1 Tax=Anguilla anguilla TaxID=7936 RepID=A0A0E9UB50_ANGAN